MRSCSALFASERTRQRRWVRRVRRWKLAPPGASLGLLLLLGSLAAPGDAVRAQQPTYTLRLGDEIGRSNSYRIAFEIRMEAAYTSDLEPDASTRRLIELLSDGMVMRTAMEYEQILARIAPDGTRVLDVRWHAFELDGEIGDMPVPPPPGHMESTRRLLRQTARMRVAPNGRTLDVTYSDPELAGLAGGVKGPGGMMPTYLPDEPVGVGDSWRSVARFPVGSPASGGLGSLELELRHRLVEVQEGPEGAVAVIELSGSYSKLQGVGDMSLGIPMHMEATLRGSTRFDIRRGRFIDGRYEIDMLALHTDGGVEVELTGLAQGDLKLLSP